MSENKQIKGISGNENFQPHKQYCVNSLLNAYVHNSNGGVKQLKEAKDLNIIVVIIRLYIL